MGSQYKALPSHAIARVATVNRRLPARPGRVTLQDPALRVMTDLSRVTAHCVEPGATIEQANARMIACAVRALFVTDAAGDLLGLITAGDILGEKSIQYMKEHGGIREDILVQDIMTHRDQLDVLYKIDVLRARVGDLVATMQQLGRQHALVTEQTADGRETVCGMFSTTQISRQLHMPLAPVMRANTFADVELAVLSRQQEKSGSRLSR